MCLKSLWARFAISPWVRCGDVLSQTPACFSILTYPLMFDYPVLYAMDLYDISIYTELCCALLYR
jgi:hypothetical protein